MGSNDSASQSACLESRSVTELSINCPWACHSWGSRWIPGWRQVSRRAESPHSSRQRCPNPTVRGQASTHDRSRCPVPRACVTKETAGCRVHTRTTLRIPVREQWYPDAPEPAVARTHPSPVVVSAVLWRVSPAGRRPGSRSGYRPRAGSAAAVSAGTTGAGRPNAGAGAVGLFLSPTQTTGVGVGAGMWLTSRAGSPQADFHPALHESVGVHPWNPSPCQEARRIINSESYWRT